MIRGMKKSYVFEDLYDLEPEDSCKSLIGDFNDAR